MTTADYEIRARRTSQGGTGRRFTATVEQLAVYPGTLDERVARLVAGRLGIPLDTVKVVSVTDLRT